MKKIYAILLVFIALISGSDWVKAQYHSVSYWFPNDKDLALSEPIPIIDQNENKILFSYQAKSFGENKVTMWCKIINSYPERVSGRFVYCYTDIKGNNYTNSFALHCFETNESNMFFIENAKSITDIYFVEFKPCTLGSKLLAYSVQDTSRIFTAMRKKYEDQKKAAANLTKGAAKINTNGNYVAYKGDNEKIVKSLLSKVSGWKTSSGLNNNDGVPPVIETEKNCQRDQYVYGAVMYAWAAESYYRNKASAKATESALKASELVTNALNLCSDAIAMQAGSCKTESILPCSSVQSTIVNKKTATTLTDQNSDTEYKKDMLDLGTYMLSAAAMLSNPSKANYASFLSSSGTMMDKGTAGNLATTLLQSTGNSSNINSYLLNTALSGKSFSQMSYSEQQLAADVIKNQVGDIVNLIEESKIFERKTDEYGLTDRENRLVEEHINNRLSENKELKGKYGYDMDDLVSSIRTFNNELLDKILSTNFPLGLPIVFSRANTMREQNIGVYTFRWKNADRFIKPLHYAAIYGNAYAIKQLLAKGADPKQKGITGNEYSQSYYSTLAVDIAIYMRKYDAAKAFIDYGVVSALPQDCLKSLLKEETNSDMRNLLSQLVIKK